MNFRKVATSQGSLVFIIALFTAMALALWWVGYVNPLTFFEFGFVAGLTSAFYVAAAHDARTLASVRSLADSCDEWKKVAVHWRGKASADHAENMVLRQGLKEMGYEVTIDRDDDKKEIRVIVEPPQPVETTRAETEGALNDGEPRTWAKPTDTEKGVCAMK